MLTLQQIIDEFDKNWEGGKTDDLIFAEKAGNDITKKLIKHFLTTKITELIKDIELEKRIGTATSAYAQGYDKAIADLDQLKTKVLK